MYRMGLNCEDMGGGWEDISMEIGDIPFNILDLRDEFKLQSNVSINGYLYWLITPEVHSFYWVLILVDQWVLILFGYLYWQSVHSFFLLEVF